MDQMKIGKFIADCRKKKKLTQMQLAEALGITDRAVSKWENGKAMPDASLMLELCAQLGITVTDLLNGEVVTMEKQNEILEQKTLELLKQKEETDRWQLVLEIVIGVLSLVVLLGFCLVAAYVPMQTGWRIGLIVGGFVIGLAGLLFALRIEQTAGYYECAECHRRYVPSYKSVLMAPHIGRARRMKCPHCQKRSWHKKTVIKE